MYRRYRRSAGDVPAVVSLSKHISVGRIAPILPLTSHTRYVPESSLSRSILQKYSASATFEPGLLGGETCLAMLTELSREVPTV